MLLRYFSAFAVLVAGLKTYHPSLHSACIQQNRVIYYETLFGTRAEVDPACLEELASQGGFNNVNSHSVSSKDERSIPIDYVLDGIPEESSARVPPNLKIGN